MYVADFYNNKIRKITLSTVGIAEDNLENNLTIYPNPNSGNFTVNFPSEGAVQMRVINILGDVIYTEQFKNFTTKEINLSNAPAGIYFITLTSDKETITKKTIVNR